MTLSISRTPSACPPSELEIAVDQSTHSVCAKMGDEVKAKVINRQLRVLKFLPSLLETLIFITALLK
jgi:hypothetical protein